MASVATSRFEAPTASGLWVESWQFQADPTSRSGFMLQDSQLQACLAGGLQGGQVRVHRLTSECAEGSGHEIDFMSIQERSSSAQLGGYVPY